MSEIPYYFETPVPKYFRETGWFESEHMFKFITWSFAKCQNVPHTEIYYGREIQLAPFEFIAGRLSSPKECFLTENIFRNQITALVNVGLLIKTNNSLKNKYSCYVWNTSLFSKTTQTVSKGQQPTVQNAISGTSTNKITNNNTTDNIPEDGFSENNNQQNNQQITNRQPTDNHKSRREKIRSIRKDHPSIPSGRDDGTSDDFSSNLNKIEIYQGIFLTQEELDACIAIKGSRENVEHAVKFIQTSKKRKHPISDWPNALLKWKIEKSGADKMQVHLDYAEKLCKAFPEFKDGHGWRVYKYHDRKKDQKGVLFESESAYQEAIFVAFIDAEFQEKCFKVLREKKMQQGRV